jgi:hypothetical protein
VGVGGGGVGVCLGGLRRDEERECGGLKVVV